MIVEDKLRNREKNPFHSSHSFKQLLLTLGLAVTLRNRARRVWCPGSLIRAGGRQVLEDKHQDVPHQWPQTQ